MKVQQGRRGQVCRKSLPGPAPRRRPSPRVPPRSLRPRPTGSLRVLHGPASPAAAAASGDSPEATEADEGSAAAAPGGGAELQEPRLPPGTLCAPHATPWLTPKIRRSPSSWGPRSRPARRPWPLKSSSCGPTAAAHGESRAGRRWRPAGARTAHRGGRLSSQEGLPGEEGARSSSRSFGRSLAACSPPIRSAQSFPTAPSSLRL